MLRRMTAPTPSAPVSPSTGPGLVLVDGPATASDLTSLAALAGSPSIVVPVPTMVLEGTFSADRRIALHRLVDITAAGVVAENAPQTPSLHSGRLVTGHHALGDGAPVPEAERGLAYLLIRGVVSNRDVYGAYLRGMKASDLLVTHGCGRILMIGPSNVRHVVTGPFAPGEYEEILSFPDQAAIEAFWFSDAYAELIKLRQGAVDVLAAIFAPG